MEIFCGVCCQDFDPNPFRQHFAMPRISLVLWPYLESSSSAELRACCHQFERKSPEIFHSAADLLCMLQSEKMEEKIRACKCLAMCDSHQDLGNVHGTFKAALAEMRRMKDGLIVLGQEEVKYLKKASRAVRKWHWCRYWFGSLLWELQAAS